MPGKRNLFSVSNVLESLNEAVHKTKEAANKERGALTRKLGEMGIEVPLIDVEIQFIGASGLPKMDVVGSADPYFVAKVDDRISFVSHVVRNSLAPVWNEIWRIKNVPSTADLLVEVHDKDEGSATDDFIGKFNIGLSAGAKEVAIQGPVLALRKSRGTFWLKINSKPSTMRQKEEFQYLFDGPVRFTRHFSPTVGLFTSSAITSDPSSSSNNNNNAADNGDTPGRPSLHRSRRDARLYSTWKFAIKAVPLFFRDVHQNWNTKYPAAQKIFGAGPTSLAVRSGIQAGHRMLYARLAGNGYGTIDNRTEGGVEEPVSLRAILNAGSGSGPEGINTNSTTGGGDQERIKPAVYTYIISSADDTLRFSETGAAFFVDFASKHALHSNCAQHVRYSGEFHPRPVGGWANFNEGIADEDVQWELVVDNNSGTYAPDKMMLPTVQECLEYNFGCGLKERNGKGERGFRVVVYDREDERLTESREACREYAVKVRGVSQDELEPHVQDGEVTLNQTASPTLKEEFGRPTNPLATPQS
ncbi:hypothetical protein MD484_g1514, partial [Candolleomyces efflorescens]